MPAIPLAIPLLITLLGGTSAFVADQAANDGNATKWLGKTLFDGTANLSKGATSGILKTVMSDRAAKALLETPADFATNFLEYSSEINWGAAVGTIAGLYLSSGLPLATKAILIPAVIAACTVGYKMLSGFFNKASGATKERALENKRDAVIKQTKTGMEKMAYEDGAVKQGHKENTEIAAFKPDLDDPELTNDKA